MSLETIPDTQRAETAEPPAARPPRRRAGKSKPGVSILAQGEPMVWLSGGALAVCLCMVAGLLGLCLWFGMRTFWPVPIYQLTLVDGTRYMGEVTRYEPYPLDRAVVDRLSGEVGHAARAALGDRDSVSARRWLVRTGNFELTETHFHWASDFELAPLPAGVEKPEWALLLERVEWGRFYGQPEAFALHTPRMVGAEEQQLKDILMFFDSQRWRVGGDTEKAARMDAALKPVREQFQRVRRESIESFVAAFPEPAQGERIDVVFQGGRVVPLTELRDASAADGSAGITADQDVIEVQQIWAGPVEAWAKYNDVKDRVRERFYEQRRLEKHDVGKVNAQLEAARLAIRQAEIDDGLTDRGVFLVAAAEDMVQVDREVLTLERSRTDARKMVDKVRARFGADSPLVGLAREFAEVLSSEVDDLLQAPQQKLDEIKQLVAEAPPEARATVEHFIETSRVADEETASIKLEIDALKNENARHKLRMVTAQGDQPAISVGDIVRAYPANRLSIGQKLAVYLSRWREYLLDDPREANSEGGVFPAIFGTVVMTLIMSLAVVPFGVLAGLYLREYAKAGAVVSAVRIAINNLAGVPSIVFGVFGLGFFCYIIGAFWDGGPRNIDLAPLPGPTWWTLLFAVAAIGTLAFFAGLYSFSARTSEKSTWQLASGYLSMTLWLVSVVLLVVLIFWTPYFSGFAEAKLPNPTYGKGGLLWASLALALLTLPVVIVATEEALSAVPNSLREGSYACGGSKWQTIKRVVLPHAMPGIMTGMILAMARGAGEVAPLMLVGAVKLAPELPVDLSAPFFHGDRSFMHLGFHIFDLGFQSQNSEAAKPMVFTTTLLLITIVAVLNVAAVLLRNRLRKRFQGGEF